MPCAFVPQRFVQSLANVILQVTETVYHFGSVGSNLLSVETNAVSLFTAGHSDERLNWKLVPPSCFPRRIPRASLPGQFSAVQFNFPGTRNLGRATIAASIFIIISLNSVRISSDKSLCLRKTNDTFSIHRGENDGKILFALHRSNVGKLINIV